MLRRIVCALALLFSTAAYGAISSVVISAFVYQGPCDLVTCAEAWNVDQAATVNYSGPLFQLALIATPTSTLDIGQTAQHKVDLSTWSAFCGGVQGNCAFSKLYGQIHASVNDLLYYPDLACGGSLEINCACPFQLNATTGLPEVPLNAPCRYTIAGASDNAATGVTGGSGSDITVIATGRNIQTAAQCCNFFGANHRFDAADTPGTDFGMGVQYSNTGAFANCGANKACMIADLEINTISGPDFPASPIDLLGIMTWDHVGNTTTGLWNGHSAWSQTPPVSLAPGNHIHLGGGGDLTQPAPFIFRGGYVMNSVPSGAQETALLANVTAFYPLLSFP
jgi:hypothetical protein